jgi:hypothetical protein
MKVSNPKHPVPKWRWRLAAAGILLLLGITGFGFLAQVLKNPAWPRQLQTYLNTQTGWRIAYSQLSVTPFPRIHLNLKNVDIQIPGLLNLRMKALKITPKIQPLLWGRFELAEIVLVSPSLRLFSPASPAAPGPSATPPLITDLETKLQPAADMVSQYFPNGEVRIENGDCQFPPASPPQPGWDHIQARIFFTGQKIKIQATARESAHQQALACSGVLAYHPGVIDFEQAAGAYASSSFSNVNGRLAWRDAPSLTLTSGTLALGINALVPLLAEVGRASPPLQGLTSQRLNLRISSAKLTGFTRGSEPFNLEAQGTVDDLLVQFRQLPGGARIQGGTFNFHGRTFALHDLQVNLPDSKLLISGELTAPPGAAPGGRLTLSGNIGAAFLQRLEEDFNLPQRFHLQAPIKIASAQINWGPKSGTEFSASLGFPEKISLDLAGDWSKNNFYLEHLSLADASEKSEITCRVTEQALDFTFQGKTSAATYNRLFLKPATETPEAAGQFQLHMEKNNFKAFSVRGNILATHLWLPVLPGAPVTVEKMTCSGQGKFAKVALENVGWGETQLSAFGQVKPQNQTYTANLTVTASNLDIDALINSVTALSDALAVGMDATSAALPWQLDFAVTARQALLDSYTFSEVGARLLVAPQGTVHTVDVLIDSAKLGGMKASGKVHVEKGVISLAVTPQARQQDLQVFLNSLSAQAPRFTGHLDISGQVSGSGKQADLVNSLQGTFQFKATEGRIYSFTFLSQILSVINMSEILVGTLPGFGQTGVGYSDFSLQGNLQGGKYEITQALLKADNMDISGQGSIGLEHGDLDLVILVAPFKTFNRIIDVVPVVNYLFNNHLIAFPIAVRGTLTHPQMNLTPLSLDEGLFGVLKRTLLLPVYLASPLLPKSRTQAPSELPAPQKVSPTATDR